MLRSFTKSAFKFLAAMVVGACLYSNLTLNKGFIEPIQSNNIEDRPRKNMHDAEIQQIQIERRERLSLFCRRNWNHNLHKIHNWNFFLVDSQKKIIYAWIPKVLSSTMFYAMVYSKPAFHQMYPELTTFHRDVEIFYDKEKNFKPHVHGIQIEKFGLVGLRSYPLRFIPKLLSTYFVFVIVRDPFTRLASTYNNLIRSRKSVQTFWGNIRATIMKIYHPDDPRNKYITFSEFLDYITDPSKDNFNAHWENYENIIQPCNIRFDYIAKKETADRDLPIIMSKISKANTDALLNIVSNTGFKSDTVDSLYQSVSQDIIQRVICKYRNDFQMFGYDENRYLNKSRNIQC